MRPTYLPVSVVVHVHVGTKTVTITEAAYERLKAPKREGEGVSDVVNRLAGGDRDVWNGFGKYSGEDGERLREAVDERCEGTDREMHG